jgi:hypothetical protein
VRAPQHRGRDGRAATVLTTALQAA